MHQSVVYCTSNKGLGGLASRKFLHSLGKRSYSRMLFLASSYTGESFLRSALSGRAATVHVRAGRGDGTLVACFARGLGVQFVTAKQQVMAGIPSWPLTACSSCVASMFCRTRGACHA